MTPDDAQNFLGRLNALAELFDAKCSEVKQQLYFEALKDLPLWVVQEAMSKAAQTCTFMPKPVELRILAHGDPNDLAEQAWVEFKGAAHRLGAYRDWMPDDPETARALIDIFGTWPRACHADLSPEMWASKRKEFLNAYKRHYRTLADAPLILSGQLALERGVPVLLEFTAAPLLQE